jgi:hypothetical protein
MPRGSKPGERRGGRQRATPNRRTVLAERILSIAAANATAPHDDVVMSLISDRMLPAFLRLAVARKYHSDAGESTSSINADRTASAAAAKKVRAEGANSKADHAILPILFGIIKDRAAQPREQRAAALGLAQYFLPKKTAVKRARHELLVADECGFVVGQDLARELRDLKLELDCLPLSSKKRSPHIVARKAAELQKRIREIQQSLECPCPSRYRLTRRFADGPASEIIQDGEIAQDNARIDSLRRRRAEKKIFTPEEDLEEAIRMARYDSFLLGHEMNARAQLTALQNKQRAAKRGYGPPLNAEQKAVRRALMLLYPQPHYKTEFAPDDHPFFDLPIADEGASDVHARTQATSPRPRSAADNDFDEFAPCPPFCAVDRELSEKKGRTVLKFWYEDPNSLD